MSLNISPSVIQICDDGTFVFKGYRYRLAISGNQTLTPDQYQQIVQRIENLLGPHLAQLDKLNDITIQEQGVKLQDRTVQLPSNEQEIFKQIQTITIQALSPPIPNIPVEKKDVSEISLWPKPKKKKNKAQQANFPWPPKQLKQDLLPKLQSFKEFVNDLRQSAHPDALPLLEYFEKELEKIKSFKKNELADRLKWAESIYEEELKDSPHIPLFFKNEFKDWLQKIEQACSWEGVQKAVEASTKRAYQAHALDKLLRQDASDREHQLGQIFLHLHQVDRPQYLQMRLQAADKLFTSLSRYGIIQEKEQQALLDLLQELHSIVDPLIESPLVNHVKALDVLPSYSTLDKLKEAVSLIFAAIKQFFRRHSAWMDAQKTSALLVAEHCDFDGNLLAREKVKRHTAIPNLLASKQALLQELRNYQPHRVKFIQDLEKEIAFYQKHRRGQTWIPSSQLRNDFACYQQAKKKGEEVSPEQAYIPALVNSRIHEMTTEAESFKIHRSGAISYLLDGSTNLIDLKEKVMDQWKGKVQANSFEEFHTLAYQYFQTHWDRDLFLALQSVEKRQKALEDQMVQYIGNQVKAHILDIADSSHSTLARLTRTIQITQIGLLNPLKKTTQKSGLQINERNQMLDMAAIFQHFNGKQIEFDDVPAPFMYEDVIYLPLSFLQNPETGTPLVNPDIDYPFKISCTFFNTSVQGLKINQGEQKNINANALQQMEKNLKMIQTFIEQNPEKRAVFNISPTELTHRFKQVRERLEKGETGYAIAQDIALLQRDMQGIIGINCFSGKDRTGYLIAKIVAHFMDRRINQRKELSQEKKKALAHQLRRNLMNMETGMASKIVYQNTGHKVLKIEEKKIMGINEGDGFSGDLIRLGYALFAFSAQA